VHHFLVTFTVPRELGLVLRGSQSDGYRFLFDSSAQTFAMLVRQLSHWLAVSWASSACCILGDATCEAIIPTFTTSFPVAE
jgi:hypothetical protein